MQSASTRVIYCRKPNAEAHKLQCLPRGQMALISMFPKNNSHTIV